MSLHLDYFLESLKIMGVGWLSVFAIIGILIVMISILHKIFPDKN